MCPNHPHFLYLLSFLYLLCISTSSQVILRLCFSASFLFLSFFSFSGFCYISPSILPLSLSPALSAPSLLLLSALLLPIIQIIPFLLHPSVLFVLLPSLSSLTMLASPSSFQSSLGSSLCCSFCVFDSSYLLLHLLGHSSLHLTKYLLLY